jgi:hypothetical protein
MSSNLPLVSWLPCFLFWAELRFSSWAEPAEAPQG